MKRNRVARVWERLHRALRLHGIVGLFRLLPRNVAYVLDLRRRQLRRSLDEFDRRFGVDTASHRSISTLDVPLEIAAHATRYEPIASLERYLRALDIAFEHYTFIDYGCGKGRALLMASDFPFKKIIGVEYSAELASIARRNIERYRSDNQKCLTIRVSEGNAGLFDPPDTAAVFFFHNPFDGLILEQVLDRIRQSHSAPGRVNYLVYVDPRHRGSIEAAASWEIVADHHSWVVYRSGGVENCGATARTSAPDGWRRGASA